MRLINAESLNEKIEKLERRARKIMMRTPKGSEAYNFAEERVYTLEDVKIELGDEPIAYDVDAVVKQIEEWNKVTGAIPEGSSWYYELLWMVKNGGVSNETD